MCSCFCADKHTRSAILCLEREEGSDQVKGAYMVSAAEVAYSANSNCSSAAVFHCRGCAVRSTDFASAAAVHPDARESDLSSLGCAQMQQVALVVRSLKNTTSMAQEHCVQSCLLIKLFCQSSRQPHQQTARFQVQPHDTARPVAGSTDASSIAPFCLAAAGKWGPVEREFQVHTKVSVGLSVGVQDRKHMCCTWSLAVLYSATPKHGC